MLKNKNKIIIGVLGILGILLLIFIGLKLNNNNKLTDLKNIPIIYQKNEQFYIDSVNKEALLLPEDILQIKYVTDSGSIYYEDTNNNLCVYDNNLNKSILDLPELFPLEYYYLDVNNFNNSHNKILNFSLNPSSSKLLKISGVEDIDCPLYLIDDDNKATLISKDAELIAITKNDQVLFKDSNSDLLIYSDGNTSILDANLSRLTIWNEGYDKLIYNKTDNTELTLNIYDSKDNSTKEVFRLYDKKTNWFNENKIILLNNDTMSFETFSFKDKKTSLYIANINNNIEVDEIDSISGSYDLKSLILVNNSESYGVKGINYKKGLDRVYYTKAINESSGFKEDIIYYYDINDKKVYKLEDIKPNSSFIHQYDDRIHYYTFDNELVEVLHKTNTPDIIGVVKKVNKNLCKRFNSNTYFYDGDKSFYINGEIIENDMNIKSYDGMDNPLYFTKNKTLNMFSAEDNKIYTLCDDIMSIDKVYLNNTWINKDELIE